MNLSKLLPYLLFGFAAIAGIIMLWTMLRSEEDEYEDEDEEGLDATHKMQHAADTMELPESEARKSRMLALKDSLDKSLQTRAAAGRAGGLDRLAMPWFMLVGTEGSGKKSLLASTGLPLPYGPPVEVDSIKKDSGRWWLFEQAVVVEAPTAKPIPKPAAPSAVTATEVHVDISDSWNNLLHLLRRERPDSPLNGIIVAISCADLVGTRRKSPEELNEQAELIKAFLEKTRQVLGVRLPIHLLITRCDVIPGFRSFAETLPEARRDDIFGWVNPQPLERPFNADTVDAGFVELQKSLEFLHDELLAAPERINDADGLFVFVNEFGEIQDPLKEFVTRLMPSGERRPSLFFRGVYFTGDASEFAARSASKADDEQATLHISIEATEAESHSLVFLRSLFANKIFQEAGLARSTARLKISRDIRVVVAQAAAILIAVAGGLGLWASINGYHRGDKVYARGLKNEVSAMTLALAGLAIDADELRRPSQPTLQDSARSRQSKDGAVVSLVSETHSLSGARLRSPFIPSSWFSKLPKEIDSTVVGSIQDVALPVIRLRLQERENRLMGTGAGPKDALPDDLDPSDPESLKQYLNDVRELSRNLSRFNRIAKKDSGSVEDLSGLLDYLFASRPADSLARNAQFQRAIRVAAAPTLTVSQDQVNRVLARATRLVAVVSDSAARALAATSPAARPEDDLDGLGRIKSLVDLADPKTGLVATVSDSTILGARLARSMEDSVRAYIGRTALRVLRDTIAIDGARARLTSVVTELYKLRLLEPGQGREITADLKPGEPLRWDVGRLELAIALRGEELKAGVTANEAFKPAAAARLKRAFALQMRSRTIDLAASAERFTTDTATGEEAIRIQTENLDAASSRLVRLSRVLDTLNARAEGRTLLVAGVRQGEQVLAMAQAILDTMGTFTPHPAVVAAWHGPNPIGQAALAVADSGEAYIKLNREGIPSIVKLAGDVAPVVKYLKQSQIPAGVIETPKLLSDWTGIVASVDKYNATDFSSSLFALRDYVTLTMGALEPRTCEATAAKPDTLKAAADWFVSRRRQFRATLVGRCGQMITTVSALTAYDKLRDVFTTKLAGHFPFVDSSKAAAAPDADPAAVRELYGLYDAFARFDEQVLRADPRVGPGGKQAFTFLDQLARARPFFAPFIDSAAPRKSPEYAFMVLPGKGAVTFGKLQTGKRSLTINDSVHTGVWGFGEPVEASAMAADSTTSKPVFKASGWWGLVELATLQHDIGIRVYHPDTQVPLAVPVFPQVAPVIPRR